MENQSQDKLNRFYLLIVCLLMLILPLLSVIIEFFVHDGKALSLRMIGKWFIFWAIGIRLFTAGFKQVLDPSFTAKNIFHISDPESFIIVKELGFANICLGLMGILSLFMPHARMLAAICGGLFFGIAGTTHTIKKPAGTNEKVALASDIFVAALMLIYIISLHIVP